LILLGIFLRFLQHLISKKDPKKPK